MASQARASHILVKTEEQANQILKRLADGGVRSGTELPGQAGAFYHSLRRGRRRRVGRARGVTAAAPVVVVAAFLELHTDLQQDGG